MRDLNKVSLYQKVAFVPKPEWKERNHVVVRKGQVPGGGSLNSKLARTVSLPGMGAGGTVRLNWVRVLIPLISALEEAVADRAL